MNRYESLRNQGWIDEPENVVRRTTTIIDAQDITLQVYTCEAIQQHWVFGILWVKGGVKRELKLFSVPGWYKSEEDALLYAYEEILAREYVPNHIKDDIVRRMYGLRNKSLFDI